MQDHPRHRGKPLCDLHRGKKRYNSGAAADRALSNIRNYGERREAGKPQRAYECPTCKAWFLTSSPQ